ncbi:hypothetical protein [Bradyrhizobium sp. UFLA05-112]
MNDIATIALFSLSLAALAAAMAAVARHAVSVTRAYDEWLNSPSLKPPI